MSQYVLLKKNPHLRPFYKRSGLPLQRRLAEPADQANCGRSQTARLANAMSQTGEVVHPGLPNPFTTPDGCPTGEMPVPVPAGCGVPNAPTPADRAFDLQFENPLLVNNARPNPPVCDATLFVVPPAVGNRRRSVDFFWFNRAHILTPCWPTTGSHLPNACPPTAGVGPVSHCRCEEQPPPPTHLCCAACRQPAGRGLLFGLIERTSGTGVGVGERTMGNRHQLAAGRDGRTDQTTGDRPAGRLVWGDGPGSIARSPWGAGL